MTYHNTTSPAAVTFTIITRMPGGTDQAAVSEPQAQPKVSRLAGEPAAESESDASCHSVCDLLGDGRLTARAVLLLEALLHVTG